MQDRFRFRVWNKEEKEMIYNAEFAYDGINYHSENFIERNNNDLHICCFGEYLEDKNYAIMQSTGLKDKNGKLIFEGDIVKFRNIDNKYYIGTIKYTDEDVLFCLSYKNENNRDDWDYVSKYRLEVIGNIYENKSLLESEG